jgi:hypothetical protein
MMEVAISNGFGIKRLENKKPIENKRASQNF